MKLAMNKRWLVAVALLCIASACRTTSQTRYLHKNADTSERSARSRSSRSRIFRATGPRATRCRRSSISSCSQSTSSRWPSGQVNKIVRGGSSVETLGPADYQKLGKDLGVDGVFVGSVVDYAEGHAGSTPTPEVTIQCV